MQVLETTTKLCQELGSIQFSAHDSAGGPMGIQNTGNGIAMPIICKKTIDVANFMLHEME